MPKNRKISLPTLLCVFFTILLSRPITLSSQPVQKALPPPHVGQVIRIPTQKGCFALDIKLLLGQDTRTLSITGIAYDHLEGRTINLGSLQFKDLEKRIAN